MADQQDNGGEYDFAPKEPEPKRDVSRAPQPAEKAADKVEKKPRTEPRPEKMREKARKETGGEIPLETPAEKPAEKAAAAENEKPDRLLEERQCPHCGFKIVGKAPRGRCPECAAMLDEQTTGRLQFSDSHWLTAISNGAMILAGSVVVQGAAIALGWKEARLGATVLGIAAMAGAAGVWLLTKPEPGIGAVKLPLRSGARWAAVAAALLWIAALLKGAPAEGGRDVLAALALLVTAVEGVLIALDLRMLAARIPNESLGTQLLNLAFFVPGISLTLMVLQLIGQADVKNVREGFFCAFSVLGVLGLVMLWSAITLLRMATELRNCVVAGQNIEARKIMKAQQQEKERQEREKRGR